MATAAKKSAKKPAVKKTVKKNNVVNVEAAVAPQPANFGPSVVFKYDLNLGHIKYTQLNLPAEAQLLEPQLQGSVARIWARCPVGKESVKREILSVYTGADFTHEVKKFLGTIQSNGLVYHLFEL